MLGVCFNGHVVTKHGIRPDPMKTDKLKHYPVPVSVSLGYHCVVSCCVHLSLNSANSFSKLARWAMLLIPESCACR